MNWLRNNYKEALLYLFVAALLFCVVKAYASDYPCQDTGFAGQLIGDTPTGPVVITDDAVYAASYSDTEYFFEYLPLYNRIIIPLSAFTTAPNFTPATCTYTAEYNDVVFGNGFE